MEGGITVDASGKKQVFWTCGTYDFDDIFSQRQADASGARMVRLGDKIVVQARDYDHEDHRAYEYETSFSVMAYAAALEKLQKEGSAVIDEDGSEFRLKKIGDRVAMSLSSVPSPGSTPGGACLSGTCDFGSVPMERLLLKDPV